MPLAARGLLGVIKGTALQRARCCLVLKISDSFMTPISPAAESTREGGREGQGSVMFLFGHRDSVGEKKGTDARRLLRCMFMFRMRAFARDGLRR